MKQKFLRWLKIILIVYALIGIGLYYFQDRILFQPVSVEKDHNYNLSQTHKELNIPYTAESNINIVQFPAQNTSPKGVVLYFHGNKENISRYAKFAPHFTRNQYEVWMIDYPGFGKSTGEFSERNLYNWALIFYKLARARFSPDSIIIYGKSMGTGIATQLASIRDCKYLILETPYYSFPSVLDNYLPIYPFERMIHFKIPTWKYIQDVTAPVIILHGTSDWTIFHKNAKRLRPYLKPHDRFITIEGGSHNNLHEYAEFQGALDSLMR